MVVGDSWFFRIPIKCLTRVADRNGAQQDGLCHGTGLLEIGFVFGDADDGVEEMMVVIARIELGLCGALILVARQ